MVHRQGDRIGTVAERCEPFGIKHNTVEFVAVDDKKTPAVGCAMDRLAENYDMTEATARKISKILVVIARDIDQPRALARLAQKFLDNVVVGLRPVPTSLHAPSIDDIPDEVEIFRFGIL